MRCTQLSSMYEARGFLAERGRPDEPWPVGTRPDYDSTSRPFVCLRATSRALGDVLPVRDVPRGLDVVRLDVQVVEVERVLPHVELEQRDGALRRVRLLVEQLLDDQARADRVPAEHGPAGALDAGRRRGEVRLKLLERAEVLVDGRLLSSPSGWPPPFGDRFVQKIEWLTWPPRLKARSFSSLLTFARLPLSRASASWSSAVFAPATYVAWCLSWCSSMILPLMCGSRGCEVVGKVGERVSRHIAFHPIRAAPRRLPILRAADVRRRADIFHPTDDNAGAPRNLPPYDGSDRSTRIRRSAPSAGMPRANGLSTSLRRSTYISESCRSAAGFGAPRSHDLLQEVRPRRWMRSRGWRGTRSALRAPSRPPASHVCSRSPP